MKQKSESDSTSERTQAEDPEESFDQAVDAALGQLERYEQEIECACEPHPKEEHLLRVAGPLDGFRLTEAERRAARALEDLHVQRRDSHRLSDPHRLLHVVSALKALAYPNPAWKALLDGHREEYLFGSTIPINHLERIRRALGLLRLARKRSLRSTQMPHLAERVAQASSLQAHGGEELLIGWTEILPAIARSCDRSDREKIKRLNERTGGPIKRVGDNYEAKRSELVQWYFDQEGRAAKLAESSCDSDGATKELQERDGARQRDLGFQEKKRPNAKGRLGRGKRD